MVKVRWMNKSNEYLREFLFRQVALADVILVNKIDLVSQEDKSKLFELIR